jgi:hypothetical protein
MLYPYARTAPPRAPCLVDRWVGTGWRLVERHELHVRARPAAALEAFAAVRIRDLPPVRVLFALRGLRASPDTSLGELFSTPPFVLVDAEPGRELVGGIMLPPRDPSGRRRPPLTPYAFRAALREAPVAAVATFRAEPAAAGARLWTETWVRTSGAVAGVAFGAYWLAIGPWSAWIRRLFLRAARERAEAAERARAAP